MVVGVLTRYRPAVSISAWRRAVGPVLVLRRGRIMTVKFPAPYSRPSTWSAGRADLTS